MEQFNIRKATENDFSEMMKIYEQARVFMKENGNESQWGLPKPGKVAWPSEESVRNRIKEECQYVCTSVIDGKETIVAAFVFKIGIEKDYIVIENGKWLDDRTDYGVIHVFASNGLVKGSAKFSLNWALEQAGQLRIDTHPNNKPMQSLLAKCGFTFCGNVYMSDIQNDDVFRLAYCKTLR